MVFQLHHYQTVLYRRRNCFFMIKDVLFLLKSNWYLVILIQITWVFHIISSFNKTLIIAIAIWLVHGALSSTSCIIHSYVCILSNSEWVRWDAYYTHTLLLLNFNQKSIHPAYSTNPYYSSHSFYAGVKSNRCMLKKQRKTNCDPCCKGFTHTLMTFDFNSIFPLCKILSIQLRNTSLNS